MIRLPARASLGNVSLLLLILASLLAASCASVQHRPDESPPPVPEATGPVVVDEATEEPVGDEHDDSTFDLSPVDAFEVEDLLEQEGTPSPLDELAIAMPELSPEEIEEERSLAESSAPAFDIPMVLNDKVMGWLDYYSRRHADSFLPGLVRSGRYLPMIREIFEEEGLPLDLAYMAHVESAYKTNAYSRAHAKGLFQFISGTGRKYGLRIDYWEDERSDPEKSARAATAYLKDLYAEFGDWYLALAAYNAGEGRMRRAIARTGTKDFWAIARTRHIRRETKNYVPAILAATLISKDPLKYGFFFEPDPPVEYDTVRVEDAVDLRVMARCAGSDVETLKQLNPALRRHQTPPGRASDVHVPKGTAEATLAALEKVPADERILYARHVIRQGDTLWEISRRYGVSISAIQQANGMGRRTLLSLGRVLKIPTAAASSYSNVEPLHEGSDPVVHQVRRGDTLSGIATHYRTTARSIAAANGIRVSATIYPGQRLKVVPGGRHTAASGGDHTVHTVRRGDTLWRIASRYRCSVAEICALNRINPKSTLYPGTKLSVPSR